jgi:hypothetical protein
VNAAESLAFDFEALASHFRTDGRTSNREVARLIDTYLKEWREEFAEAATVTEWGVRHRSFRADMPPDSSYGYGPDGEAAARRVAARNEGLRILARDVTEWREVTS